MVAIPPMGKETQMLKVNGREEILAMRDAIRAAVKAGKIDAQSRSLDFPRSLIDQWNARKRLSDKQWSCVADLTTRYVEMVQPSPETDHMDFLPLVALLDKAAETLEYPKLRLFYEDNFGDKAKVVLSRAGASSKLPGSVNVTDGGPYGANVWYGRIGRDGKLDPSRNLTAQVQELLETVSGDTVESLDAIGRRFGICCCCGRKLTKAESIDRGIGPICAEKWGL